LLKVVKELSPAGKHFGPGSWPVHLFAMAFPLKLIQDHHVVEIELTRVLGELFDIFAHHDEHGHQLILGKIN
jgi:hypothetical protein